MKIAQLVAAFQKFTRTEAEAQATTQEGAAKTAPPRTATPPAAQRAVTQQDGREVDQITVSPEAVFVFAASRFDPRSITRNQIRELADTLHDGGAISNRDHAILSSPTRTNGLTLITDPAAPGDLVTEFQGRLSSDLAGNNIAAVEADTRALSILGRLASIRQEIT